MTLATTRRSLLGLTVGSMATLLAAVGPVTAGPLRGRGQKAGLRQEVDLLSGPFALPPLDYSTNALEPVIDTLTMEIHHGKHHQAYIDNLNKVVAEHPEIGNLDLWTVLTNPDSVPEPHRLAVRNNLGGFINHSFYWQLMSPERSTPSAQLTEAIDMAFGSLADMQAAVTDAGVKRFGSGWVWVVSARGELRIISTPNQDNPLMDDAAGVPIIGIDVWEHAYYLKYQNRRQEYLEAWWNVINWPVVDREFAWSTSPDFR